MTVSFLRNKIVETRHRGEDEIVVYWRLADDLMDVEMNFTFSLPDLEIIEAAARVRRSVFPQGVDAGAAVAKVVGVRIGPGLRKIVRGLLGAGGNIDLIEGILECCNAVILDFTLPGIEAGEIYKNAPEEKRIALAQEMVKANPRLARSCVAFADDSPIMQGLNLEGGKS
jgi:hypothetical protein